MRYRFRFRAIPFVATVLLVALGVSLGHWQERRAADKNALQARLSARGAAPPLVVAGAPLTLADTELRRVSVAGQFVADWPMFLDNRPLDGKVGFYLVMPFRIAGSERQVLVARGWLPRFTGEHDRLPEFGTPSGTIVVHGIAKAHLGKVMQLGQAAEIKPRAILQNLTVEQYATASGQPVQPFFIEQSAAINDADQMVRNWPAATLGVDKHKGYAFQWYALAVMALLFFVITGFRLGTK